MIWLLIILVPGIMFHLLPLTTITFCCSWLFLMLTDAKSFNRFGSTLAIMCIGTLMLFAVRCITILAVH